MSIFTFINPVADTSMSDIKRLIAAGQLVVSTETVVGTPGTVYAPVDALVPTISAVNDHELQIGQITLNAPIYRLPEWPYSHLIRISGAFRQYRVGPMMGHLLRPRLSGEDQFWSENLLEEMHNPPVIGPIPMTIGEPWSPEGRFLPELTRVILRGRHAFLQIGFELPYTTEDKSDTVVGLDIGIRPLITAAVVGGGTWRTSGIYPLEKAAVDWLYRSAHRTGIAPGEVKRTLDLIHYAACRMAIEEQTGLYLRAGVRAVIVEAMQPRGLRPRFIPTARNQAVYFLHAWLPQMLHAQGAQLIRVDPAYTSRDCSQCPWRGGPQREVFVCGNCRCRHSENVHVNAARNIAKRGMAFLR
jgi:hypothetical protein